jgi:hypothetical protein
MVGASYPDLLVPTAVLAAILVFLLVGVTAMLMLFFVRVSNWTAGLEIVIGSLLVFATSPFYSGKGNLYDLPLFFAALIAIHGYSVLIRDSIKNSIIRNRHRFRVRRLRRRISKKPENQHQDIILMYMAKRRYFRSIWKRTRQSAREAMPIVMMPLTVIAVILFLSLAGYLFGTGERIAETMVAEGEPTTVDVFSTYFLLNVKVDRVRIIAIAPRFKDLEQAEALYLGTNDGVHILYDAAARQAVLVPSGSVALQFTGST